MCVVAAHVLMAVPVCHMAWVSDVRVQTAGRTCQDGNKIKYKLMCHIICYILYKSRCKAHDTVANEPFMASVN